MVYDQIKFEYGNEIKKLMITKPADLLAVKQIADLSAKPTEYFMTLSLDGASHVIKTHIITKGLVNHSLVHPRETFRTAIMDNAVSIICVHNHPSGNPEPSSADLEITKQLKSAGEILGIQLLDHIIITDQGIYSLREYGYI